MKGYVEIGHLKKSDAFRVNRDQVTDLEKWFKIHTNISNFETASLKSYKLFNFFMFSVILFEMGNYSDFHLSFFQITGT